MRYKANSNPIFWTLQFWSNFFRCISTVTGQKGGQLRTSAQAGRTLGMFFPFVVADRPSFVVSQMNQLELALRGVLWSKQHVNAKGLASSSGVAEGSCGGKRDR